LSGKGSSNLAPTEFYLNTPQEKVAGAILPKPLVLCHLFFGIAILGSTLHVSFGDALPICCRYIASAGVSRLLLTFEFDTLKARTSQARESKMTTEVVRKSEAHCGGKSTREF